MKTISYYFCVFLLLVSCTKELEYPLEYEGDKLVLYSFLETNKPVEATVLHSIPPVGFQSADQRVKNAVIDLFADSIWVAQLTYRPSSNSYKSSSGYIPEMGKNYYFTVSATGYPDIISEEIMLFPAVEILEYRFQDSISITSSDAAVGKLEVLFRDDETMSNFYNVESLANLQSGSESYQGLDLLNDQEGANICNFEWLAFPDICFDGEDYWLNINFNTSTQNEGIQYNYVDVYLNVITEGLYLREGTIYNEEGFFSVFAEPAPLYTNIIGGYGLVGSISKTKIQIIL